jgi:CheY-like chemotaxis protein
LEFEDSIPLFSKAGPAGKAVVNPGNAAQLKAAASAPGPQKLDFEDSIPLFSKAEPAAKALVKHGDPRNRNQTILLIEDDTFAIKLYGKALTREGFQVNVAEDGLAAVEMAPKLRPGLIVLDLMLPGLDGLEILKFIRGHQNLKDIPVIVLSYAYMDQLAVRASQAGATRGLLKTDCTPAKLVAPFANCSGTPHHRRSSTMRTGW